MSMLPLGLRPDGNLAPCKPIGPGLNMLPRSAKATVASELALPSASRRVPSIGSTAISIRGSCPVPSTSPLYSMGASSFSPSPITTMPSISTEFSTSRMASTAARSPPTLSPRPMKRPAASAAASVTRTSSSARLRSGRSVMPSPSRGPIVERQLPEAERRNSPAPLPPATNRFGPARRRDRPSARPCPSRPPGA